MLDLIAVMYMYCCMVLSDPDASTTDITLKVISEVYPNYIQPIQAKEPEPPKPPSAEQNIDCLEELKKMGYFTENTEDKDLNMRIAFIHFQSDHNLTVNGEWDDNCVNILKKRRKDKTYTYPDTVKTPPSREKWITINKTKRILTLYENNKVVKKYPVAVGNPPSLTPEGKFTIVCKVENPEWGGGGYAKPVPGGTPQNPLGYRWLGLSIGGGSDYGVHGNNNPYSIGTDASHGCVRMCNKDVESLFEIVAVGTEVWIGTDKKLVEWGVNQKEFAVEN